jgi:hypothetical protein
MSQENVEVVKANYEAFAQGGVDRWRAIIQEAGYKRRLQAAELSGRYDS